MQIANNLGKQENSELSLTYRLCKLHTPVCPTWIGPIRVFFKNGLFCESQKIPDSIWTGMPCIDFLKLKVFLNINMKP